MKNSLCVTVPYIHVIHAAFVFQTIKEILHINIFWNAPAYSSVFYHLEDPSTGSLPEIGISVPRLTARELIRSRGLVLTGIFLYSFTAQLAVVTDCPPRRNQLRWTEVLTLIVFSTLVITWKLAITCFLVVHSLKTFRNQFCIRAVLIHQLILRVSMGHN